MLSATITGAIISGFEEALSELTILVTFFPLLMGTGGNAGSQASTLIIRGLALDEIQTGDVLKVLARELGIGFLCGLALGAVNFIRVYLTSGRDVMLSLTVTLSLIATVLLAKCVGCLLPLGAKKLKLDPAIMAAPLITTIVDAASLMVFFTIAKILLQHSF
jgi:magnesium transporter